MRENAFSPSSAAADATRDGRCQEEKPRRSSGTGLRARHVLRHLVLSAAEASSVVRDAKHRSAAYPSRVEFQRVSDHLTVFAADLMLLRESHPSDPQSVCCCQPLSRQWGVAKVVSAYSWVRLTNHAAIPDGVWTLIRSTPCRQMSAWVSMARCSVAAKTRRLP